MLHGTCSNCGRSSFFLTGTLCGECYSKSLIDDYIAQKNTHSTVQRPRETSAIPLYDETIIGTCSLCGGPVVIPTIYQSVVPPIPRCKKCGAYKKESYGPVIEMEPAPPNTKINYTYTDSSSDE